MPLKTAKAAQKPVKEFLPASFKLQLEKEEQEREQRKKMSDGPGRYLRAPKEEVNDKGKVTGPGSVEFRVMGTAEFGFSLWYETEDGGRACKRWLSEELLSRGIEGGNIPEERGAEAVEEPRQTPRPNCPPRDLHGAR